MPSAQPLDLSRVFQQVGQALQENREALNQADPYNANHGDHMVAVLEAIRQAALAQTAGPGAEGNPLAEMMDAGARRLDALAGNGSAQVYGRGLRQLAEQFRRYQVQEADLLAYVRQALAEDDAAPLPPGGQAAPGDVLKALVSGLAAWGQDAPPSGEAPGGFKLSMGALLEFGMAYLQARQRGGSRIDVLADAAASVSPLNQVPHRYESARIALAALLRAIQSQ